MIILKRFSHLNFKSIIKTVDQLIKLGPTSGAFPDIIKLGPTSGAFPDVIK